MPEFAVHGVEVGTVRERRGRERLRAVAPGASAHEPCMHHYNGVSYFFCHLWFTVNHKWHFLSVAAHDESSNSILTCVITSISNPLVIIRFANNYHLRFF